MRVSSILLFTLLITLVQKCLVIHWPDRNRAGVRAIHHFTSTITIPAFLPSIFHKPPSFTTHPRTTLLTIYHLPTQAYLVQTTKPDSAHNTTMSSPAKPKVGGKSSMSWNDTAQADVRLPSSSTYLTTNCPFDRSYLIASY